jgi:hypothetical protein
MKSFSLNQIINSITTSNLFIKGGSTVLIVLSIVIVWQLMNHGNIALGAYMLIEKLHKKFAHPNNGTGSNTAEEIVHIVSHNAGH